MSSPISWCRKQSSFNFNGNIGSAAVTVCILLMAINRTPRFISGWFMAGKLKLAKPRALYFAVNSFFSPIFASQFLFPWPNAFRCTLTAIVGHKWYKQMEFHLLDILGFVFWTNNRELHNSKYSKKNYWNFQNLRYFKLYFIKAYFIIFNIRNLIFSNRKER